MDIFDEMIMMNLKRTFYQSNDSTCAGRQEEGANTKVDNDASDDASFILPLDVCVGPFGPPRPWGKFTLVYDIGSRRGDDDNNVVISAM